jgi:hypothetical protein
VCQTFIDRCGAAYLKEAAERCAIRG